MEFDPVAIPAVRRELGRLGDLLADAEFPVPGEQRRASERERRVLVRTIREYLLPRIDDPGAPAVVVIVGASGTGKSTLLNSLAQERISDTGIIRPTTKAPVLWTHRDHEGPYWAAFIELARDRLGPGLEIVVGDDPLTEQLAIIDTTPFDYPTDPGAFEASELLSLCDIAIYVTSPLRYADAAGWEFIEAVQRRGVTTLHAFNRLPEGGEAQRDLVEDYTDRLYDHDLLIAPDTRFIFGIPEDDVTKWNRGLEPARVRALRNELAELTNDEFRRAMLEHTAVVTTINIADRAQHLSESIASESDRHSQLGEVVEVAYDEQIEALKSDLDNGDFREMATREVWAQAAADLAGVVTRRAGVAAQRAAVGWSELDGGRDLLLADEGQSLWRHGEATAVMANKLFEEYATGVVELAASRSPRKPLFATARRMADTLWRPALDPEFQIPARVRRRYGNALESVVGEVRRRLGETLAALLRADSERFIAAVGPAMRPDLADEVAAAAQRLLELAGPLPDFEQSEVTADA